MSVSRSTIWIATDIKRAEVWERSVFRPRYRRKGKSTIYRYTVLAYLYRLYRLYVTYCA